VLILAALASFAIRGLNLASTSPRRRAGTPVPAGAGPREGAQLLEEAGFNHAAVQSFGSSRDVMVRLLPQQGEDTNKVAQNVLATIKAIRRTCSCSAPRWSAAVGAELANKGAMAILFTFRGHSHLRRAALPVELGIGAIVAALHDPIIILGFFSETQMTFDLPALARFSRSSATR